MKYDKDAPFEDPVLRCDSCQALIQREQVHRLGMCSKCGNRRVRNVILMTETEMAEVKGWNVDPEWIALFEAVPETEVLHA